MMADGGTLPVRTWLGFWPMASDLVRILRPYDGVSVEVSVTPSGAASEVGRNELMYLSEVVDRTWCERYMVYGPHRQSGAKVLYGFVHLRTDQMVRQYRQVLTQTGTVTAEVPRALESYLCRPPGMPAERYRLIEGFHTAIFGTEDVEYPVTPFVTPHRLFASQCAQGACHMALTLLRRVGARPLGLFDILRVARGADQRERKVTFDPTEGLAHSDIPRVLRKCGVECHLLAFPREYDTERVLVELEAYLRSGCPIVAAVDIRHWAHGLDRPVPSGLRPEQARHAMLVVGYEVRRNGGEQRLVAHDTNLGPFVVASARHLIESGRQCDHGKRRMQGFFIAYAVVPSPVKVALPDVLAVAAAQMSAWQAWGARDIERGAFCQLMRPELFVDRFLAERYDLASVPNLLDVRTALEMLDLSGVWLVSFQRNGDRGAAQAASMIFDAGGEARRPRLVGSLLFDELRLWDDRGRDVLPWVPFRLPRRRTA